MKFMKYIFHITTNEYIERKGLGARKKKISCK